MPRGRPRKTEGSTEMASETLDERALTPAEKQGLENQIAERESMLENSVEMREGVVANVAPPEIAMKTGKMRAEVDHLRKVLAKGTVERARGKELVDLEREEKRLRERFQDHLETWRDLGAFKMESPEYKAAFNKGTYRFNHPEVEADIARWKEVRKRIRPDDPEYQSLDSIRKDA